MRYYLIVIYSLTNFKSRFIPNINKTMLLRLTKYVTTYIRLCSYEIYLHTFEIKKFAKTKDLQIYVLGYSYGK